MTKIFISYRRGETIDITGRIYDWLIKYFGKRAIFRDLNTIPYGADFRKCISQAVRSCGVMLLVIGKEWVDMKNEEGVRRLDDPTDPVLLEIEEALAHNIPIIPVLVQGAKMPRVSQLPVNIREIHNRNAIDVSSGADFPQHMVRLISALTMYIKLPTKGNKRRGKTATSNATPPVASTNSVSPKPPVQKIVSPGEPQKSDKPAKTAPLPPLPQGPATSPTVSQTKPLQLVSQRATIPAAYVGHDGETRAVMPGAAMQDRLLNGDTVIVRIPNHVSRVALDARKLFEMIEWCDIPAGKICVPVQTISAQNGLQFRERVFNLDSFTIGKFLITNAQYAVFTAANDGYQDLRWWQFSPAALDWRMQHPIAAATPFVRDNLPRVNVNWYEAMAFCYWLSYKIGVKITLPTEQQWQRAAQGNDQREYPWGNVFDPNRVNSLENGIGGVTPVTEFSKGRSPFGVYDVAGNVQQWTLTEYTSGANTNLTSTEGRVIRGGSWKHKAIRVTQRFKLPPQQHADCVGFRVVMVAK